MKREVERERELPAFTLTVDEFDLLWHKLSALFDDPKKVYGSIDIQLPFERLNFSGVDDLKQYNRLPARIASFTMVLS